MTGRTFVSQTVSKIEGNMTRTKRDGDEHHQEVDEPMFELVMTHRGRDNRTSKTGRDAHADATYHAADHDVPQHALLAIPALCEHAHQRDFREIMQRWARTVARSRR